MKSATNKSWGTPVNDTFKLSDPLGYANSSIKQFFINNEVVWTRTNTISNLKRAYERCSPLGSILDNICDTYANGKIHAYNTKADGTPRNINIDWEALLLNPNWLQDQSQFFRQLALYRKLFGWCYVIKNKPKSLNIPTSMWVLPNWLLDIEYMERSNAYMFAKDRKNIRKISLCLPDGYKKELDPNDLILFTDNTNTFDEDTWLPRSRVSRLEYPITLTTAILEAETTLIQNKGAIGIVSGGQEINGMQVPMTDDAKEELQLEFRTKYGLTREQWQLIFSREQITYTPIVFNSADLQLKETLLDAIKQISEGLHYPFILTAFSDQSTYNNIPAAEKRLYQDLIIPDAESIADTLAKGLGANDAGVTFIDDFRHIEVLQDSLKDKGDGLRAMSAACKLLFDNNLITWNMWLEKIGEPKLSNELYNKYKREMTPEELGIIDMNNGQTNQETTARNQG